MDFLLLFSAKSCLTLCDPMDCSMPGLLSLTISHSLSRFMSGDMNLRLPHPWDSHVSWRDIPGSPVPGILQARTLEWVAISFSNAWKWKVKVKLLSRVRLLATPWTAAYQAPTHGFFQVRVLESGAIAFSQGVYICMYICPVFLLLLGVLCFYKTSLPLWSPDLPPPPFSSKHFSLSNLLPIALIYCLVLPCRMYAAKGHGVCVCVCVFIHTTVILNI